VFPMSTAKRPLTAHGSRDATRDPKTIKEWWTKWTDAQPALLTGMPSGVIAIDIDLKGGRNGLDTLEILGIAFNPVTPTAHTPSGGLHWLFRRPGRDIPTSATTIGPGVEIKGERGWITLPPGPGRFWDPHLGLKIPLAPLPQWAMPQPATLRDSRRDGTINLSRYGEAALDGAARSILAAPYGEQEVTLNREAYAIGRLAGSGAIPPGVALDGLLWTAKQLQSHDPRRPWRMPDLERKIKSAFTDGLRKPRRVDHGRR